jgi:hypothetical protein
LAPVHVVAGAAAAGSGEAALRRVVRPGQRDPHLRAAASPYPAEAAGVGAAAAAGGGPRLRPAAADATAAPESGGAPATGVQGSDLLELLLQGSRPQLLRPPRVEGPLGTALLRIRRPLWEMLVRTGTPLLNHFPTPPPPPPIAPPARRPARSIRAGEAPAVGGGFADGAHRIYVE